MQQMLSMKSLSEIDNGRLREAFDQALRRAHADCKDRPSVKGARKISLQLSISPVVDVDTGDLDSCDVGFKIKEAVPERGTRAYNMVSDSEGLVFNDLARTNARQQTLDDAPAPRKVATDVR